MKLYSNPKHSDEYLQKIEWNEYQRQLEKEDKEIGEFLKRAVLCAVMFSLLALAWSVVGN